ncbi:MAG: hypothetical protein AAGK74_18855, partial [Chloroflexota bacterium]
MVDQSRTAGIEQHEQRKAEFIANLEQDQSWMPFWLGKMLRAGWPAAATLLLILFTIISLFGPLLAPKDPNRQDLILRLQEPLTVSEETGQVEFYLGTDALGRDVLSRLLYGARISLWVGVAAVAIGGLLGTLLGLVSGYTGGRVDDVIMR